MSELRRYKCALLPGISNRPLLEDPGGDWVRFSDAQAVIEAAVEEKDEEIERMKDKLYVAESYVSESERGEQDEARLEVIEALRQTQTENDELRARLEAVYGAPAWMQASDVHGELIERPRRPV